MSTTHQRGSSKERFWRRMVQPWRRSGLSIRDFCAEQQLAEPTFYAWRRTIAQRDGAATRFVPVHGVPDATPVPAEDGPSAGLERVVGRRRIRIGSGFEAPTLQRLLALLAEGQA